MRGFHHIHLRKRRAPATEPYPARTPLMRFLDRLVLVVGVIGPVATIPQILKIYLGHEAAGVSALSWGTWALLDVPWILYGLAHRERPIVLTYCLWFFVNLLVFVGALMYGAGPL